MDRSKETAMKILELYLAEAEKKDFIKSIILVGSLSDDDADGTYECAFGLSVLHG